MDNEFECVTEKINSDHAAKPDGIKYIYVIVGSLLKRTTLDNDYNTIAEDVFSLKDLAK
jgi:hypothetical protein